MSIVEQIRERVASIPEPCGFAMGKPTTLGAMGLIEHVAFEHGHAIITLCLTDTACVHFNAMRSYVSDVLVDLPEVIKVTVSQTLTTLWTPDRMTGT